MRHEDRAALRPDPFTGGESDEVRLGVAGEQILGRALAPVFAIPDAARRAVERREAHLAFRADQRRTDLGGVFGLSRRVGREAVEIVGPIHSVSPR